MIGLIGALAWYLASRPSSPAAELIARRGLHWHAELAIFVNGQKQEIPADVGLGVTHNPVHTHDDSGLIHLEFSGAVRPDDIKLGQFFQAWNKNLEDFGTLDKMTVNGQENSERQNYVLRDGDKIELHYHR